MTSIDKSNEVPRLINLLIEFEEKVEGHLNKKYKPFLRSIVNIQSLKASIHAESLKVKRQLIIVKLGLESKSLKAIIITLQYLLRLLQADFVPFNDPDYTEHFIIGENDIREQPLAVYNNRVKTMLKKNMSQLVHFKSEDVNNLLAKSLEYLIGQDILQTVLALSHKPPTNYSVLLYSYLSYRFYIYEEMHIYTERELRKIQTQVAQDERLSKMTRTALDSYEAYEGFVGMYVSEIVSQVALDGGKYGHCVICHQKAQFHCKDTKASICGKQCKAKHLELCSKFDDDYVRARQLHQQMLKSLEDTLSFIGRQTAEIKSKSIIIEIINTILKKPYLTTLVDQKFCTVLRTYLPNIIFKLVSCKQNYLMELGYSLMCSIVKYYKKHFIIEIQQFISKEILAVFEERKPKYQHLLIVFAFIAEIVGQGRHILELYVNLDCAVNRDNSIEKIMYELGRILQDRFNNASFLNKNQRHVIKSQCLDIHCSMLRSLMEHRKEVLECDDVETIMEQKNKKISLEKFVFKFNENWAAGLKALYNFNLISLDGGELIEILLATAKLKKSEVDAYLLDKERKDIFQQLMRVLSKKPLPLALLEYYSILQAKEGSLSLKMFIENYESKLENVHQEVEFWFKMLCVQPEKTSTDQIKEALRDRGLDISQKIMGLLPSVQSATTVGRQPETFYHCYSGQHVAVIEGQIGLLQIAISHLLQTSFELPKTLQLALYVQTLCQSSSIFALLIKSTNFQYAASTHLTPSHVQIINFLIDVTPTIAQNVPDWFPILRLYNDLYYFAVSACLTPTLLANKNLIVTTSSIGHIEGNIIKIGTVISQQNYPKLMLTLLKIGGMEAQYDRSLMLQKFFEIYQICLEKSIKCCLELFPKVRATCLNNCFNLHTQMGIYTVDLLKQNILKMLQSNVQEEIQTKYIELLQEIYVNAKTVELREFIINCLSMIVENHFSLYLSSWKVIIEMLKQGLQLQTSAIKETINSVLDKIMSQNLRYLLNFYDDIVGLMLQMVSQHENKIAIKTLVNLRVLLDFLIKESHAAKNPLSNGQSPIKIKCKELLDRLLPRTLLATCQKLAYDSHDTLFEIFFVLMKRNYQQEPHLIPETVVNEIFDRVYDTLMGLCSKNQPNSLMIAEKFISDNVGWAARLKHFYTLDCLARTIIGNYNGLSLIAVKGLKSFIQTLNPQIQKQWDYFTDVLLRVLEDCRLCRIQGIKNIQKTLTGDNFLDLVQKSISIRDTGQPLDVMFVSNQLLIQKLCLQLLPNDPNCVPILQSILDQVNNFNENLYLRCVLWKKGFGAGSSELPSLLFLEEIVINRILSIYNCNKDENGLMTFANEILKAFCKNSRELAESEVLKNSHDDWDNLQYELLMIYMSHHQKRKQLLIKVVGYLLPKLLSTELKSDMARQIGDNVIDLLEFLDEKELPLKLLRSFVQN